MNLTRLLTALLLISALAPVAPMPRAQTPNTDEARKEKERAEARRELEKKALVLLEEVVGDAQNLKVAENRAHVLAGAADLLWTRDEKRARALFRDAAQAVNEASARTPKGDEQRYRSYWSSVSLRQSFLRGVARRDPQLAVELLQMTRPQTPAPTEGNSKIYQQPDLELKLEQSLAMQVASSDPKRALQMAEESLSKGVSHEVLGTIHQLHAKDAEAAAKLARTLITRLRTENLSSNPEAIQVAFNLLRSSTRPQLMVVSHARMAQTATSGAAKPFELDTQATRDLIDLLVASALTHGGNFLMMLQSLMPEVEKHTPERAPLVRRRLEEFKRTLDPQTRRWEEYGRALEAGTPEAVLEAAAKAPAEMRQAFYSRAAWLLAESGDTERARQIVNEYLKDSSERGALLARLDQLAIMNSIKQGKIDAARKLVAQINSPEERATTLARLAVAVVAAKGERKAVLELLEEAQQAAGGRVKTAAQINTQLQLARAYALVEPPRAFEIVETVVERANEMIAAADILDGFMGRGEVFREGELVMSYGMASLETIYLYYGRELSALARADFERALAAASKFQRPEVRTVAKLLIAQGLLSDREPLEQFNDGLLANGVIYSEGR
ncbi:MAG TPA: hypothetical protein VGV59_08310 [Pyrinomonadaceae bacterium]|nr:hypothetical protein [Pyrinomonadaceae bacterium]